MANRYGYMPNVPHTIGENGRTIPVSETNPLPIGSPVGIPVEVAPANVMSVGNSFTTPLLAGETFTGVGEDVTSYSTITISLFTDVESELLGLKFEFSLDNITWYTTDEYTYTNDVMKTYSLQIIAKYFRVRYINNATTPQTVFNLSTI